jgi:hypothetical protein
MDNSRDENRWILRNPNHGPCMWEAQTAYGMEDLLVSKNSLFGI